MRIERLPGESTFRYHLRLNGREYRDRITVLMQDHNLTWEQAMDAEWGHLLPQSNDWKQYALQCRERRVGERRLTIHHVWSLVNLIWPVSYDQVYELLSPNRKQQNQEKHARYRAKNRQLLAQKELARYYRKKNQDLDS